MTIEHSLHAIWVEARINPVTGQEEPAHMEIWEYSGGRTGYFVGQIDWPKEREGTFRLVRN